MVGQRGNPVATLELGAGIIGWDSSENGSEFGKPDRAPGGRTNSDRSKGPVAGFTNGPSALYPTEKT